LLLLIRHLLQLPLVALAYLSFAGGGGVLGTFVMPLLYLWPGSRQQKRRRCQIVTGWAFRVFHYYLDVIGIMAHRPPAAGVHDAISAAVARSRAAGGPGAVMVVANHPTLVDTTAIMASYPFLVVVAKSSVFYFPLLRLLLQFCGHTVATAELGGEAALAEQLIERLKQGESVLLFPESTRSPDEGPRPFRRGPFEIALRAGVPIQPVLIDSGPGLLKGGLAWHQTPLRKTHYRLRALPAIFPAILAGPPESNPSSPSPQRAYPGADIADDAGIDPVLEATSHLHSGRQLAQLVFSQISEALRVRA